jgi:hypothetical protein
MRLWSRGAAFPDNGRRARLADGVWFLACGSHNSVLIEMSDHVVLVETPLNDARMGRVST